MGRGGSEAGGWGGGGGVGMGSGDGGAGGCSMAVKRLSEVGDDGDDREFFLSSSSLKFAI